jgi:hypothetical protein
VPVVLVDSGKTVSSLFVVRGDRPFTVQCPSQSTGYSLFAEFAQTSAGTSWDRLARTDGTGGAYVVASCSGNFIGVVQFPATPFVRLVVTSGPSSPMSFSIADLNRA